MPQIGCHLRYRLSRAQRLIPHLRIWGPLSLIIPAAAAKIISLTFFSSPWWSLALLPFLFLFRGFFLGSLDVIFHRDCDMDIVIEDKGLGFLAGGERWWIFLDGIINIAKYRKDVWTIQHHNGVVVNILASQITDDQLAHLKSAAARGRTPEGIQAVVARGRRMVQLYSGESGNDSKGSTND